MKATGKRKLSLLLCLVLVIGSGIISVSARHDESGFVYNIQSNRLVLSGYDTERSVITIPKEIEGYTVTQTMLTGSLWKGCTLATAFSVQDDNENFCVRDGALFTKDGKTLLAYPQAKGEDWTLPQGCEKIASYAFNSPVCVTFCAGLKTIASNNKLLIRESTVLPQSLDTIGSSSFVTLNSQPAALIFNNPDCTISSGAFTGMTVLCGAEGSTAQTYAMKNGLDFILMGQNHVHRFILVEKKAATCIQSGEAYCFCPCGEVPSRSAVIPISQNHRWQYRQDDWYCTVCELSWTAYLNGETGIGCDCICHSDAKLDKKDITSIFNVVWYRLVLFFWRITKTNQYCACGYRHY